MMKNSAPEPEPSHRYEKAQIDPPESKSKKKKHNNAQTQNLEETYVQSIQFHARRE